MPRLILRFDDRVLKEFGLGKLTVTVGRLADNTVVIDNPSVSGRHARVVRDGDSYVVEDLQSTNGTFINDQLITRRALKDGDIVLVGKHKLVFDASSSDADAAVVQETEPFIPELGGTVMLDTREHKSLIAGLGLEPEVKTEKTSQAALRKAAAAAGPVKAGVLRVLAGRADQPEYTLAAQTSLIGKSETSLVRLKGWFKPQLAVAIARKGSGHTATWLKGKALINGQPLRGRQDLKSGDVLEVCGLTLEYHLNE